MLAMIILDSGIISYRWLSKPERGETPEVKRLPIYYEPNTEIAEEGERTIRKRERTSALDVKR
jgi:hypothetical protein